MGVSGIMKLRMFGRTQSRTKYLRMKGFDIAMKGFNIAAWLRYAARKIIFYVLLTMLLAAAAGCNRKGEAHSDNQVRLADHEEQAVHANPSQTMIRRQSEANHAGKPSDRAADDASDQTEPENGAVCLAKTEHFDELRLVRTDTGFELGSAGQTSSIWPQTLLFPGTAGPDRELRAAQPDQEFRAVQIVRRLSVGQGTLFRLDAVLLDFSNPDSLTCAGYPLFESPVHDTYNVDSIAMAYGFLADDRLLFVAAAGDAPVAPSASAAANVSYQVQAIDFRTGAIEVLVPEIPDAPMDDFFSRGWLTADGTRFVMNAHDTGMLWTFDLVNREVRLSDRRFKNHWPITNTWPSPDGHLFWYTGADDPVVQLCGTDGNLIAAVPVDGTGFSYPHFLWAPDGQYAAQHFIRKDRNYVYDSDAMRFVTPHGIHFFDRRGRLAGTVETSPESGEFVELAAWLGDGAEALIHFFELVEEAALSEPHASHFIAGDGTNIRTIRYERLRIETGERTILRLADEPMEGHDLIHALPLGNNPLYWIDAGNHRIVPEPLTGSTIPLVAGADWAWYAIDREQGNSLLVRADREKGIIAQRLELPPVWPDALIGRWLVSGASYDRIHP
jgi:hypothetical protein